MARKSRKNLMPQAAAQEAVQQNEKELLRTAAYARLSVENWYRERRKQHHTKELASIQWKRRNGILLKTRMKQSF